MAFLTPLLKKIACRLFGLQRGFYAQYFRMQAMAAYFGRRIPVFATLRAHNFSDFSVDHGFNSGWSGSGSREAAARHPFGGRHLCGRAR